MSRPPPPEVEHALSAERLRPRQLLVVSPQRDAKRGRVAYRVRLDDGASVKARLLESEEVAESLRAIRAVLEPAFTRVLARHGRVLLEEWIDGRPVGELAAESPFEPADAAGRLLARLHATQPPVRLPQPTLEWLELARAELGVLEHEGTLPGGLAAEAHAILEDFDCRSAPSVIAHRDFCGENMLIDRSGDLRVFDNEWFQLEPAGFDLGRSYARWAMSDLHWRRFCEAYRSETDLDPGPIRFWQLAVALWSIRVRREREPERLGQPIAAVQKLLR
jgi:hypothetical protein